MALSSRRKFFKQLAKATVVGALTSTGCARIQQAQRKPQPAAQTPRPEIYPKQMPRQPAITTIENTPDAKTKEVAYIKLHKKPGRLYYPEQERFEDHNEPKTPYPFKSLIHTHPVQRPKNPAFADYKETLYLHGVSPPDLVRLVDDLKRTATFSHMVKLAADGKVVGCATVMATKEFIKNYKNNNPLLLELLDQAPKITQSQSTAKSEAWLGEIKKLGLKIRLTPMKGYIYAYDERYALGYFQKLGDFLKTTEEDLKYREITVEQKSRGQYIIHRVKKNP